MSKTKLPDYVYQQCVAIVRGYKIVKADYKERRQDILDGGGARYTEYVVDGEERRAFLPGAHNASRTTEDKQMQLDALEHKPAYKQMMAVEHALNRIGVGLPEMLADYLRSAIYQNCLDGRKYTFERLYTVGISRSSFYRYKAAFLWDLANELGLI